MRKARPVAVLFFWALKFFLSKRQENVSIRYLAQVHSGVFDEKRLG
jgi:hypothetical protein